jgi:hypothetical protein
MSLNLDELEAKARAAEAGPRRIVIDELDKAFIAVASPRVVLRLIAIARAAEGWAKSDECDKFLPNKRWEQEILDALSALETDS